jgi:WD40 repeat protein
VLYSKERPEFLMPEQHWPGRPHAVWGLAVSPDGKRLAASSIHGQYVAVWDAATGKEIAKLDHGHRFPVRSLAFTLRLARPRLPLGHREADRVAEEVGYVKRVCER